MANVSESEQIVGVCLVDPEVYPDDRGTFVETYRRDWFPSGLEMVQGNRADRRRGCLVGLHYHLHQSDYWYVPAGLARVVLHDLREGSTTDGATLAFDLGPGSAEHRGDAPHRGVLIPPGVAHGFAALTDVTLTYLVDRYYNPADELGIAWDDPDVQADWALTEPPLLSPRDLANPPRAGLPAGRRPHARLRP